MNKFFYLFVAALIFISSYNAAALIQLEQKDILEKNNRIQETWKYTLCSSYPEIIDTGQYVKIKIKEANEFLTSPENPILPFYSITTTFPLGTRIIEVKCVHSKPEKIYLKKDLFSAPKLPRQSNIVCSEIKKLDFQNLNTYKSTFNECCSYKTGGGIKDGKHVTFFSIQFYPVFYLTDENAIQFIENAELEVFYEKPLRSMVYEEDYSLVIIAPSSFSSQLQPLVTHKNKYGISAKIVTLEEIFSGKYFPAEGRDNAEKIKYFIKNSVEQWKTIYVLLVGNIYKLPIRKSYVGEWVIPTDLYYADVFFSDGSFSSWDTNGNNRYGEYWQESDDIVDLYPDIYIGRLACKNSNEVRIVINKIIKYETSVYGKNWFKRIILCGGDTHPYGNIYEGEVTLNEIEKCMPDFSPIKLYTSENSFTPSSLNRAINNGAGFLAYSGHGFEISIGTHPPNSEKWASYNTINLLGLFNINKLPIVFFDACLTARLDVILGDLLKLSFIKFPISCIAWCFVKKILGGAIATIGATREAFSRVKENGPTKGCGYLALHFFKNYEEGTTIADMFVSSQNHYLDTILSDPLTVEEFILLGDPSLKVGGYNR